MTKAQLCKEVTTREGKNSENRLGEIREITKIFEEIIAESCRQAGVKRIISNVPAMEGLVLSAQKRIDAMWGST